MSELIDLNRPPYTPIEERAVEYILAITADQIGAGLDPVGFLIASHNALRERLAQQEAVIAAATELLEGDLHIGGNRWGKLADALKALKA